MAHVCNVNEIIRYLEDVSDRQAWHLVKISTKNDTAKPIGKTGSDLDGIVNWITASNENRSNIYEQVNPPKRGQAKKATRDEVKWLTGFHVDWDVPEDLIKAGSEDAISDWLEDAERKLKKLAKPSGEPHIIMTGNGLQARWPFHKEIKATPDAKASVEDVNARIAHHLGADRCHNCDRVLRVPGTTNWPNAKKRKAGYTPVMAELWHVSTDEFQAGDFAHLKKAPMRMKIVSGEHRIDWTQEEYTDDYAEITMEDLMREDPIIHKHAEKRYREVQDRSSAVYTWLKDCIRAFCHIMDCEAADLLDDPDIYKNICELIVEANAHWLSHYDDAPDKLAKLGMDLQTCIYHTCDEVTNTSGTRARAATKRLKQTALTVSHDKLTPLEHRRLFIDHVRSVLEMDDLPNVIKTAGHVPSARQSATESNIREIFDRAGIVARWNAMKDEASYDIRERAGRPQAGDTDEEAERRATAPRFHFQRALAATSPDMASAAQESLISDALHEQGITARRELNKLFEVIAKEDRFHPLEDYCTQSVWDGRDRIGELAEVLESDNPLKRTYLDIFFRQGVAAVCSLDEYRAGGTGEMIRSVVVLVGPQGIGKTTFWRTLIPRGMKSKGEVLRLGGMKEADTKRELLSGLVAICDEIGAGLDYSQQEDVKNFISATSDAFRVAYAHWPTEKPRMTQFVGTSNRLHLKDDTGTSRWLAMDVVKIRWESMNALMDERGYLQQCYAQAWQDVIEDDAEWWLTPKQDRTRAAQNVRYESQMPEIAELEGYLANATGRHYKHEWLNVAQICKVLDMRHTPAKAHRISEYLLGECVDFKDQVMKDGRRLRNVFHFPVTVDMLGRLGRR